MQTKMCFMDLEFGNLALEKFLKSFGNIFKGVRTNPAYTTFCRQKNRILNIWTRYFYIRNLARGPVIEVS